MGNENSTNKTIQSMPDDIDYLNQFYGKDNSKKTSSRKNIISGSQHSIFLSDSGLLLPYVSRYPIYPIGTNPTYESDVPTQIELVVYEQQGKETVEKYKVQTGTPNHKCGKNCYCMEKTIIKPFGESSSAEHMDFFESVSQNVQQLHKLIEKQVKQSNPLSNLSTTPNENLSSTSDVFPNEMANVPMSMTSSTLPQRSAITTGKINKPFGMSSTSSAFQNDMGQVPLSATSQDAQSVLAVKMSGGSNRKKNIDQVQVLIQS